MSDTSKALTVVGFGETTVTIAPGFLAYRDATLQQSAAVRVVHDDATYKAALATIEKLASIRLGMERTREFAKAPILEAGRKVDAMAKEAAAGAQQEEARLGLLVKSHLRKIAEAAEAERKREAEEAARQKAIEDERLAEIERKRLAAEEEARKAQEALAAATKPAEKKKAAKAVEAAQAAVAEVSVDAELAAFEASFGAQPVATASAPVPYVPRPEIKHVWKFEVLDVMAFASKYPDLCKIEIATAKVNAAIADGTFDVPINAETTKLVGNAWKEAQVDAGKFRMAPGLRIFKDIKL